MHLLESALRHVSGSMPPAELVELYLQSAGSAAAFEETAQLPKGTVTGTQPQAASPKEAMRPSEPLLPSSSQLLKDAGTLSGQTSRSKHVAQAPSRRTGEGTEQGGTQCCAQTVGTTHSVQAVCRALCRLRCAALYGSRVPVAVDHSSPCSRVELSSAR